MPNQKRNFRNHLTLIVGPPDQKAIDQNIGNWTNVANDSIYNLWIEHISSFVDLQKELGVGHSSIVSSILLIKFDINY